MCQCLHVFSVFLCPRALMCQFSKIEHTATNHLGNHCLSMLKITYEIRFCKKPDPDIYVQHQNINAVASIQRRQRQSTSRTILMIILSTSTLWDTLAKLVERCPENLQLFGDGLILSYFFY